MSDAPAVRVTLPGLPADNWSKGSISDEEPTTAQGDPPPTVLPDPLFITVEVLLE
jgi:hypothetical protein